MSCDVLGQYLQDFNIIFTTTTATSSNGIKRPTTSTIATTLTKAQEIWLPWKLL